MYTITHHTKGWQAARNVIGNYHIYDDPIIEPLELSLKSNYVLLIDE